MQDNLRFELDILKIICMSLMPDIKTHFTGVRDWPPWPGPAAGPLPADPERRGAGGGAQLSPGLPDPRHGRPGRVLEVRGRPHHPHLQ